MKAKFIITLLSIGLLTACSKDKNKSASPSEPTENETNTQKLSTVTITTNGQSYTSYGYDLLSEKKDSLTWAGLAKSNDPYWGSHLAIGVSGAKMPFMLDIEFKLGAADGLGAYTRYSNHQEIELNGEKLTASDTASAVVTAIEGNWIKGTFYVKFFNSNIPSITKEVTGTFDIKYR